MPLLLQHLPKRLIVIDFPIEHQRHGAILVEHGLHPCIQINNAQPPKPKQRAVRDIGIPTVRSPVLHDLHHSGKYLFLIFRLSDHSTNSTHILRPSSA